MMTKLLLDELLQMTALSNIKAKKKFEFLEAVSGFLACPFLQSVACFSFIIDVHLLTGCMAVQTVRSVLIVVCMGQLAWVVWQYRPFDQC